MTLEFCNAGAPSLPLYAIHEAGFEAWIRGQSASVANWARANGFTGKLGQALMVPGETGEPVLALAGLGTPQSRARVQFSLAGAAEKLPSANFHLAQGLGDLCPETECLGWLLSQYSFDRYKACSRSPARLVAPSGIDAKRVEIIATSEALIRDMINTPAEDMGPQDLQARAETLAAEFGARCLTLVGPDLLGNHFPVIHAVGRAAEMAPRLIEMQWGDCGPRLTLVGKGVCFDTGGLNLKGGQGMSLMKKDMGGAAHVLGLARMIMALGLRIQLRVLIPAVENSVAGNALRPGDILTSRKGFTVEVNNTDAEGRLVLSDALAYADEDEADLIISMATLTGAARIALGPNLAPFYCDDEEIAQCLTKSGNNTADPVWRMPFHTPYEKMIEPLHADLDNAPATTFAGSVTAALFLRRFVTRAPFLHFDIFGWQPDAAPGRPKGGTAQGARAVLDALPALLKTKL